MSARGSALLADADGAFARAPWPPCYAVILTSQRTPRGHGYDAAAALMAELAAQQPGDLGVESVRDAHGVGITVRYRGSEDAAAGWRRQVEHAAARERGRNERYEHHELRVAKVERAYGKKSTA
jgi:heme-degrading monooxygenase HmoA